jgi:FkbM family methyltransferase
MKQSFHLPRENLAVYGLGGAFHWFHEIFMLRLGYRPDYLADRNAPQNTSCEGIPLINDLPSQIQPEKRHCYTVVVCTGREKTFAEIRAQLIADGFKRIFWIHQLYEIHDPFGLSQNTFTHPDTGQAAQIRAARALFRDDLSLEIFDRFVETHCTKIPRTIPQSPADEQYFPKDIGADTDIERLVLCGSDTHDLNRLSSQLKHPLESLIIFEADPYLFDELSNAYLTSEQTDSHFPLARSCILSPCAVSSTAGIHSFASANHPSIPRTGKTGFGSRLCSTGHDSVQTISLDQAIQGIEPDYICMDIEGEELNAISGARRIITRSRTNLAISVYHKASHIWEVPLLIQSINKNHDFYIRNYTGFSAETILYAFIHHKK